MKNTVSAASIVFVIFAAAAAFGQEGAIRNQSDLRTALSTATTPEDHARIACYYRAAVRNYIQSRTEEEQIAARWQKQYMGESKTPNPWQSAISLAAWYGKQADDAQARADEQDKLAKAQALSRR